MAPNMPSLPPEASCCAPLARHDQHAAVAAGFGTPRDLAHCALHALNASRQRGSLPAVADLLHGVANVRGVALQQVGTLQTGSCIPAVVYIYASNVGRCGPGTAHQPAVVVQEGFEPGLRQFACQSRAPPLLSRGPAEVVMSCIHSSWPGAAPRNGIVDIQRTQTKPPGLRSCLTR